CLVLHPLLTEPVEVRQALVSIKAGFRLIRVGTACHREIVEQVRGLIREPSGPLNGRAATAAHVNLTARQCRRTAATRCDFNQGDPDSWSCGLDGRARTRCTETHDYHVGLMIEPRYT